MSGSLFVFYRLSPYKKEIPKPQQSLLTLLSFFCLHCCNATVLTEVLQLFCPLHNIMPNKSQLTVLSFIKTTSLIPK